MVLEVLVTKTNIGKATKFDNEIFAHLYELIKTNGKCKRRNYAAAIVDAETNKVISTGYTHLKNECATCVRKNELHNCGDYSHCPSIHAEDIAISLFNGDIKKQYKLYLCGIDASGEILLDCKPCWQCKNLIDSCKINLVLVVPTALNFKK